jgi:hypothetical protein
MKTQFNISSPVKQLDMGKYGEFLSPASKIWSEYGAWTPVCRRDIFGGKRQGDGWYERSDGDKETTEIWRAFVFE